MKKGAFIRSIRTRMGFTQSDVAKYIGVKQITVSAWEVDLNKMSTANALKFIKLCEKCGIKVTLEQLIGE